LQQTSEHESIHDHGAPNFSHMAKKSPALRVLVVDDEPLIRWSMGEALSDSGHTVSEAADAATALAAMSNGQRPYDVVLLDFRLPNSNDLTLLEQLRTRMPKAQIIMMTAYGTSELFQQALQLGAYRVISKPFELDELAALVLQAYFAPAV
jgi:two-component system, NtrC family, response regulator AtoC